MSLIDEFKESKVKEMKGEVEEIERIATFKLFGEVYNLILEKDLINEQWSVVITNKGRTKTTELICLDYLEAYDEYYKCLGTTDSSIVFV